MAAPTDVAGLIHRWRADSIAQANGSAVASWPALTGGVALDQATAASRPTLATSGIGGKPAVRFTSAGSVYLTAAITARSQPTTTIVIYRLTRATDPIMQLWDAGGQQIITLAPGYDTWAGVDLQGGTLNTNPNVLSYVADGAGSRLVINGTQVAAGNSGAGTITGTVNVGFRAGTSRGIDGDVAEILIYSGALSTADLATVHTYVQDQYGITVADYTGAAVPPASGSGASAWTFTGAGAGTRPSRGSGGSTWSFKGVGTGPAGVPIPVGSGSSTWSFTGSGVGSAAISSGANAPRYMIRQAHGGYTLIVYAIALPYFFNQGYKIVKTLGGATPAPEPVDLTARVGTAIVGTSRITA